MTAPRVEKSTSRNPKLYLRKNPRLDKESRIKRTFASAELQEVSKLISGLSGVSYGFRLGANLKEIGSKQFRENLRMFYRGDYKFP